MVVHSREAATEPRWPAMLTSALAFGMLVLLPQHYRSAPGWFPPLALGLIVCSMLAVSFMPKRAIFHHIESVVVLGLVLIIFPIELRTLATLVGEMVTVKHDTAPIVLLESAAMMWVFNILIFALLYWQVDRARLEVRQSADAPRRDFHFAEGAEPEPGAVWFPQFFDYLFLAFAISSSFTPPDYSRPNSQRAKIAAMAQASFSLATLVVVASRAVATLS
jgi:hypothetical protein